MARPLFISFSPYTWPYPPLPIFLALTAVSLAVQLILLFKLPRLRRFLPLTGLFIVVISIPTGLLLPIRQPGVLFWEFYTMLTVGIPGAALLLGSALAKFLHWLCRSL